MKELRMIYTPRGGCVDSFCAFLSIFIFCSLLQKPIPIRSGKNMIVEFYSVEKNCMIIYLKELVPYIACGIGA